MKKKISFILAAIMLIANMAISSVMAAETQNTMFSDVTDKTQYSEAILTLAKLGVINGYDENSTKLFKPEGLITRAEFAAIITRAMGIADVVSGVSPFTDVSSDHWAVKNIIAATDRGITNGMGDGTFHPDENVTYEQAIKMVVCAMNYTLSAEAGGGWPDGYFNQGTIMGLTKNIASGTLRTAAATRGTVTQIVYNALDIKVADINTSKETDDTFLNKFMNMEMIKGKVVGVEEDITAECEYSLARDEMAVKPKNGETVMIDFEDYGTKEDIQPYLGQEVVVFYKLAVSGGVNKLVLLDSEVTKNKTTEISYDDIEDYAGGVLEYYGSNGRKTSIDFDESDVTVYYNKKAVTSNVARKLEKWLDPANEDTFIYGSVTLTDSGANGNIDMVEIMDYDYLVALKAPSSSDYTVTNKMKFKDKSVVERVIDSVTLNPDKNSYSFAIEDQDGKKLETTSIKANNVVLVAASEEEDYFTVKVSSETVEGSVSSFSASENTVQISNKEYTITNDCIEYLKEQQTPIENGKKGKFYLDAFGNIAYAVMNVSTDSTTTMYLITAYYDEDTDSGQLRGFVPGMGYKTYYLEKKVKLDGESGVAPEEAIEYLRENSESFKGKEYKIETASNANQLIKIELDGTVVKEIVSIDASENGTSNDTATLKLYQDGPSTYKYSSNTFTGNDGKFFVNSSTVFISVPNDRTVTASYYKKTVSYFNTTENYTLEPINVNDSKIAEIVLIYTGSSQAKIAGTTPISVLAEEPTDDASSDEVLKKFSMFTNKNTVSSSVVDEDEDVEDMVAGDIFQYVLNNEGRAVDVQLRISYSDIAKVLKGDKYDWTASKFTYETGYKRQDNSGKPYSAAYMYNLVSVDEDGMNLIVTQDGFKNGELDEDADTELIQIDSNTKILKLNEDKDEIISVDEDSENEFTIEDLKTAEYEDDACSKIAVIMHNSDYAKLIIIYE